MSAFLQCSNFNSFFQEKIKMKILLIIAVVLAPGFSSAQWFSGLSQYQDIASHISDPFATGSYEGTRYNQYLRPKTYGSGVNLIFTNILALYPYLLLN
jgi:hypothetical protein